MSYAVIAMASIAVASSYASTQAQNAQSKIMGDNARQQNAIAQAQAKSQIEEQQGFALEQQTQINRNFLKERGTMVAIQAEGETTGKSITRSQRKLASSYSEVKAQYNKETQTNIINIAQGALATKIDTDRMIMEAQAKRVSPMMRNLNMISAGAQGAYTGYQLNSAFNKPTQPTTRT